MTERPSPPAAAFPPSAAEPAAGIASLPLEVPLMPAAPFFEASTIDPIPPGIRQWAPPGIRQWAIEPKQCRWILADEEAGAEALMCGLQSVSHRSFCAEHCALAYLPPAVEEEATESSKEALEKHDPEQKEAK